MDRGTVLSWDTRGGGGCARGGGGGRWGRGVGVWRGKRKSRGRHLLQFVGSSLGIGGEGGLDHLKSLGTEADIYRTREKNGGAKR